MSLISPPEFLGQARAQTFEEQLLGGQSHALRAKVACPGRNRDFAGSFVGLLLVPRSVRSVLLSAARFVVLSAARVLDISHWTDSANRDAGQLVGQCYSLKSFATVLRLKREVLRSPIMRQSIGRSSGFG